MHIKINEKKNKIKTLNFEEIKLSDNNVNLNLNISLEISILQKTQKKIQKHLTGGKSQEDRQKPEDNQEVGTNVNFKSTQNFVLKIKRI